MDRPPPPATPVPLGDVHRLDGKVVLVQSRQDHRTPPTGLRGTIEVREAADGTPSVRIAVDFPQMFIERAHRRTIPLDHGALLRLLESEDNGAYVFLLDEELS